MSDYIKRENAKRAVWGCTRDTGIDEAPFEYAEGLLEDVPAEDVEPVRHGRWMKTDAYPHRVYCSVCSRTYAQAHWEVWKDGSLARAYCPNCGAKMDEEKDNG